MPAAHIQIVISKIIFRNTYNARTFCMIWFYAVDDGDFLNRSTYTRVSTWFTIMCTSHCCAFNHAHLTTQTKDHALGLQRTNKNIARWLSWHRIYTRCFTVPVLKVLLSSHITWAVLKCIQRASGLVSKCVCVWVPWHRTGCSPSTYLLMFVQHSVLTMRRATFYASIQHFMKIVVI